MTPSCRNCRHSTVTPDAQLVLCRQRNSTLYTRPVLFGELQRNSDDERQVLASCASGCRDYQEEN